MSPYAEELAHARLNALRTLIDALNEAETPDEKRRCAVAIFNAPDPCDLDDEIELVEDDEVENEAEDENEDTDDVTTDDLEEEDSDNPEPTTTPQTVPPSLAALSERRCNVATTSPQNSTPPTVPHTPLSHSPTIFLPAPSGPAAQLIAAAGRAP